MNTVQQDRIHLYHTFLLLSLAGLLRSIFILKLQETYREISADAMSSELLPSEDKGIRTVTFHYNSESVLLLVSLPAQLWLVVAPGFVEKGKVGRIKFIYQTVNHWEGKKCLVVFHAIEGRWFGGHRQ